MLLSAWVLLQEAVAEAVHSQPASRLHSVLVSPSVSLPLVEGVEAEEEAGVQYRVSPAPYRQLSSTRRLQ